MTEKLADLVARHPCPPGHTPRKSELGQLINRYGVGKIPISELHRINTVTLEQFAAIKAKADAEARQSAVDHARRERQDAMAAEWEASRWHR